MATKDQDYVLQEFSKPDSVIRLVICTIRFGLGINIPDIELDIHWGACDTIIDCAEGWMGRSGWEESKSLLFFDVDVQCVNV